MKTFIRILLASGEPVSLETETFTMQGVAMAPAMEVANTLGAVTCWRPERHLLTVIRGDVSLDFLAEYRYVRYRNSRLEMPVAPTMIDTALYVPLAFLAEVLDAKVISASPIVEGPAGPVESAEVVGPDCCVQDELAAPGTDAAPGPVTPPSFLPTDQPVTEPVVTEPVVTEPVVTEPVAVEEPEPCAVEPESAVPLISSESEADFSALVAPAVPEVVVPPPAIAEADLVVASEPVESGQMPEMAGTKLQATEPAPAEPALEEPAPAEPALEEPAPAEPAPAEPAPAEPAPGFPASEPPTPEPQLTSEPKSQLSPEPEAPAEAAAPEPQPIKPPSPVPKAPEGAVDILLDPEHGGTAKEAVAASGLRQAEVTLDIARRTALALGGHGIVVSLTRQGDINLSSDHRRGMRVQQHPALYINVRTNYYPVGTVTGVEVNYPADQGRSRELAQVIHREVLQSTGRPSRGLRPASLAVFEGAECPSATVRVGYLSNPWEVELMASEEYREKVAAALARALLEVLGR